jgi:signal transduction histidine kinase
MKGVLNSKAVVLLVDDNYNNLQLLIEYLKNFGLKVLIAKDGQEALKRAQKIIPDLILLDIMMPGMDGFETCKHLKNNPQTKDIPIIFMSALTDTFNKVQGFKSGAVDYITKPFQHEEVLMRISTHLTLIQQKKRLAELNATKDKFFSIVAHDMRNAFSSLLNGTQFLSESVFKLKREQIDSLAIKINQSAKNTFKLLKNLLEWARLQRGVYTFEPDYFDFYNIADETIQLFKDMAAQKEITLTNDIQKNTVVYSDERMVKTIMRNLVSNAIKYTKHKGTVCMSSSQHELFYTISVHDNGIGMSKENIDRLFRIDQTFSELGTAMEAGTGLGLILCKELTEQIGGSIWAESEPDKGSTFYLNVPSKPSDE